MENNNGKSIVGLVLAIISVIVTIINCCTAGVFWFLGLLALAMGVVGIVLAAMGMKENEHNGLAIAALVVAIIGTVFSGIMCVSCNMCTCLCENSAAALGAGSMYDLNSFMY